MTGGYYNGRLGLQPASEVAELVDCASVTACNKQTDRRHAPIPSFRAERGGLHTAGVLMLSSVDGQPSGRWHDGELCN